MDGANLNSKRPKYISGWHINTEWLAFCTYCIDKAGVNIVFL